MEKEYSNEVRGLVHAYRFDDWEKKRIAQGLRVIVRKLKRRSEKIRNHPDNEGQVKYSEAIRLFDAEIRELDNIISEFDTPKINTK